MPQKNVRKQFQIGHKSNELHSQCNWEVDKNALNLAITSIKRLECTYFECACWKNEMAINRNYKPQHTTCHAVLYLSKMIQTMKSKVAKQFEWQELFDILRILSGFNLLWQEIKKSSYLVTAEEHRTTAHIWLTAAHIMFPRHLNFQTNVNRTGNVME